MRPLFEQPTVGGFRSKRLQLSLAEFIFGIWRAFYLRQLL